MHREACYWAWSKQQPFSLPPFLIPSPFLAILTLSGYNALVIKQMEKINHEQYPYH